MLQVSCFCKLLRLPLTSPLVFTSGVGYDLDPNNADMFPKRELFIQRPAKTQTDGPQS